MSSQQGDSQFTHINEQGRARMVDVSNKPETNRVATARTTIKMMPEVLEAIKNHRVEKGEVLSVAQVAGIMAAKKTPDWIPMCHPIPVRGVDIQFSDNDRDELYMEATVKTTGQTGVEMEALTAVSATALTVYDMCKALDQEMVIGPTMLISKTGGKSGDFRRNGS